MSLIQPPNPQMQAMAVIQQHLRDQFALAALPDRLRVESDAQAALRAAYRIADMAMEIRMEKPHAFGAKDVDDE